MSAAAAAVLRELQDAVAAVDVAIDADNKAARASSRAAAAHRRTSTRVASTQEERDRLAKAADLLAPDWREWPWVQADGFASKVPTPGKTT